MSRSRCAASRAACVRCAKPPAASAARSAPARSDVSEKEASSAPRPRWRAPAPPRAPCCAESCSVSTIGSTTSCIHVSAVVSMASSMACPNDASCARSWRSPEPTRCVALSCARYRSRRPCAPWSPPPARARAKWSASGRCLLAPRPLSAACAGMSLSTWLCECPRPVMESTTKNTTTVPMITIGFLPPRPSRWCTGFCSPPIAAESIERFPDARPRTRDPADRARSCVASSKKRRHGNETSSRRQMVGISVNRCRSYQLPWDPCGAKSEC